MTLTMTMTMPAYVAEWFRQLEPQPLPEVVPDPANAAVFATDMVVGFCDRGRLASTRLAALVHPVVELFQRAHAHGIRHVVLVQDAHHLSTPEFRAFPPHCVRGTEEAHTIAALRVLPFADHFTLIEKNSLHPALETDFDRWLDAHPEVHTAIVVGNSTDLCVYQLAMHLRLRANACNLSGFRAIVPAEAVDTYDMPEGVPTEVGTLPHPGDFFHQVFLYHLALNAVDVVHDLL